MKKADYILIVLILIITALVFNYNISKNKFVIEEDKEIVITVNSKEYGRYSLSENRNIEISVNGKYNKVIIMNGFVFMEEADCHDQICVSMKKISKSGESIVCLPNRVLVKVEMKNNSNAEEESEFDAISQ